MQPDVSVEELISEINVIAENTGDTTENVAKQIYDELKQNELQGLKENRKRGGSGGTVSVGTSTKGNFFYTDSQTAYLNHGHVGMYYASDLIVESVPNDGVRTIPTKFRLVDKGGACVKSVTTSTSNRNNAADWAYSRVGKDDYSYNFATNRTTSHTGAKNCSKLIWSAYMLNGNLDLDKDGGLGVYPRDVRDASKTKLVRNI
ncbi:YiiX/YebB-like N1pC/P60 family cysteine hydrolase [Lysinibacillus sp. CTST325]